MGETQTRLLKCFSAVFPDLPYDDIPTASLATVESWDSVATVTLLTVIEEEFGLQFEPDDLDHMISYQSILHRLQDRKGSLD